MGSSTVNKPSRFLNDIPPHLVSAGGWWQGEESQIAEAIYSWNKAPAPGATVPELKDGDHVRHAQFGDGIVVSCRSVNGDAEVEVVFDMAGLKKLLLSFAQLEKIE
jgi:DNA helicase-2/ATP-dependent DNA helicase PcrA